MDSVYGAISCHLLASPQFLLSALVRYQQLTVNFLPTWGLPFGLFSHAQLNLPDDLAPDIEIFTSWYGTARLQLNILFVLALDTPGWR